MKSNKLSKIEDEDEEEKNDKSSEEDDDDFETILMHNVSGLKYSTGEYSSDDNTNKTWNFDIKKFLNHNLEELLNETKSGKTFKLY